MSEALQLVEMLGLSPVCAVVLIGSALLVWDRRRLIGRVSELTDRQLDDLARRAALWDEYRKEAEQ